MTKFTYKYYTLTVNRVAEEVKGRLKAREGEGLEGCDGHRLSVENRVKSG